MRSSTTPARQLRESNIQNRHINFIEINYCEDTRPGAQLQASQQQHSELCKQLQGADITLHTIFLGVGGTIYTAHTLDQFKKLGIDPQRSPLDKAHRQVEFRRPGGPSTYLPGVPYFQGGPCCFNCLRYLACSSSAALVCACCLSLFLTALPAFCPGAAAPTAYGAIFVSVREVMSGSWCAKRVCNSLWMFTWKKRVHMHMGALLNLRGCASTTWQTGCGRCESSRSSGMIPVPVSMVWVENFLESVGIRLVTIFVPNKTCEIMAYDSATETLYVFAVETF
eukprot:1146029-Pelagomonas_calceolata.AAC.1